MKDFDEQRNDQRWKDLEQEIISRSDYVCERCGESERLRARVYFLKNIREMTLWSYPINVYRCYCPICDEDNRRLESKIKDALRRFSVDELDLIQDALNTLSQINPAKRAVATQEFKASAKRLREEHGGTYED